ncbi:ESX secretion-associated protein EspG [Pseudonocardiaceae bacterium YIM PH 21723]|nr:ESX secretion-associated protein EspG [Pseudonocardiaceae bacterium YIM PH 21723]
MLQGTVRVSTLAWQVVRTRAGIEEQHHVLSADHGPAVLDGNEDVLRQAFDELNMAGLASGTEVHPDLVRAIGFLTRPALELHGWLGYHDRTTVGFVAATDGQSGILARRSETAIQLDPIAPDSLPDIVIGLLPQLPAAHGRSITVPKSTLDEIAGDAPAPKQPEPDDGLGFLMRDEPQRDPEREALEWVIQLPRLGGGRIYAAGRDHVGRRRKSPNPITYVDTEPGRWAMQLKPSDSGEPWGVLLPASPAYLHYEVSRLLQDVTPAERH